MGNKKEFFERQQAFIDRQLEKKEGLRAQYSQEAQCTFKPEINITSEIICEADPKRGGESHGDKVSRLYAVDQMKREIVRENVAAEVYQQCTFQPRINQVSRAIAREATIDDLSYNPQGKQKKEQIAEQVAQEEIRECTFKPQTTGNAKYKGVEPAFMKTAGADRTLKVEQEQKLAEYEALKDCTFKPTLNSGIPQSHGQVVVVRGLSRHLELQELKKRNVEE